MDQEEERSPMATTRRQFLTRSLLAATGLSLMGVSLADALGQPDGISPIILGRGAHRYK